MNRIRLHGTVIEEVENSPEGKHIGALFDLDKTLLTVFSAGAFMQARIRSGKMTREEVFAHVAAMTNYIRGEREFTTMLETSVRALKGQPEDAFLELAERIYEKNLAASIYPEARALVKAHQKKGHTLAIISSATPYQVEHVARELGIENILCTRYEVKRGKFTGKVVQPICWGEGKAYYGRQLAKAEGLDLDESYFYSDSHEDLPLLEIVGRPRPLNPDPELAKVAKKRGWPVQHFNSSAKPGLRQKLRSALVVPAVLPSALVFLPMRGLTGSTKRAAEVAMSAWAELACAAAGIELNIRGRENLWSHRPCVFIYNHQSAADGLIVARVLQRDYVGIAKKEIADVPIFGTAAKAMGTVFIDRSGTSASGARSNLDPAVDAIKKGQSIVVAPEGTRSYSYKPGPFKKGAFHIAMQAGVPIVPFVIHNSLDVSPKGTSLYRAATVEVEVLPPISTRDWRPEDLDRHIAAVRDLFLDRLGQSEGAVADRPQEKSAGPKSSTRDKSKTTRTKAQATSKRPASGTKATRAKKPESLKKVRRKPKTAAVKRTASRAK